MKAFEHAIVGLDFNRDCAAAILDRATQLVDPEEIDVVHAFSGNDHSPITAEEAGLMTMCADYGVASVKFVSGESAHALHEQAGKRSDLIIVGSHGRSGLRGIIHSHSNATLHATPCDLLTVHLDDPPQSHSPPYRSVLVAIHLGPVTLPSKCERCSFWPSAQEEDRLNRGHRFMNALKPIKLIPRHSHASEESHYPLCHVPTEVILHARKIAQQSGAELSLCHVYMGYDVDTQQMERELLDSLGELYEVPEDRRYSVPGSVSGAIHRLASRIGADLVVLGTHGRSGPSLAVGSTANAVLHGATCDQLSVRIGA